MGTPSIVWFDRERIPPGSWPFLSTIWNSLRSIKDDIALPSVDLTEGLGGITITGRMEAYRQLVLRRALDLAQSTVVTWNASLPIGAVVSARGLLETLAVFYDLMAEATPLADKKDWEGLSRLIDTYALSTSEGPQRTTGKPGGPPSVGKQVTRFILAIEPHAERFWHQISDAAHPNGKPMLQHFGTLRGDRLEEKATAESEPHVFQAIYNCLYAVCWFYGAMSDFDKLLDRIRYLDREPA
jgi:hypothetical protein